jgi:hypothetical protein
MRIKLFVNKLNNHTLFIRFYEKYIILISDSIVQTNRIYYIAILLKAFTYLKLVFLYYFFVILYQFNISLYLTLKMNRDWNDVKDSEDEDSWDDDEKVPV